MSLSVRLFSSSTDPTGVALVVCSAAQPATLTINETASVTTVAR
jgi:hypothetical protein